MVNQGVSLTNEHRDRIVRAIRELETADKLQACALFSYLEEIYAACDKFDFEDGQKNNQIIQKSDKYNEKIASIVSGQTKPTISQLGDLHEFFTQTEIAGLSSSPVPAQLENYWLKGLKSVRLLRRS